MSTRENNFECEDYSIMCCLPNEILIHIFEILRLEDRKSVRLVCRSWYQYCACVSITNNEIFVFRRIFSSIEDVTKVMLKLNYSNLEFQDHSIEELPARIWEVCGHKIHSLEFFQCHVDAQTIRNIVIHCENLISFTFETSNTELGKEIFCSSQLFDELVERGIQRKELRTFAMLIDDPLEEIVLSKLFLVYPCITHFVAKTLSHQWFPHFPITLQSLKFKTAPLELEQWIEACITKSDQGLRLRHLNGVFGDMDESYANEYLLNFFLSQRDLIEIILKLRGCYSRRSFKNISFQILQNCTSLREFCISSWPFPYLKLENFTQFLTLISKLRCLDLCFRVSERRSLQFPKLAYLTTLELYQENFNLYDSFFKNCPSLLHLSIHTEVSDHALQLIFKYLLKLQTLRFSVNKNSTNYGFTGRSASKERGYSIKRLQQLKHLNMKSCLSLLSVSPYVEEIVLEFQFPHLEHLGLDVEIVEKLSEETIIHLSHQIPNLKQLEIVANPDEALTVKIVNLCKYLKNLHGLFILTHERCHNKLLDFVLEHSEEFFSCPSLRFISNWSYSTFCFNVFTHTVEEINGSRIKFKTYEYDDSFFLYVLSKYL